MSELENLLQWLVISALATWLAWKPRCAWRLRNDRLKRDARVLREKADFMVESGHPELAEEDYAEAREILDRTL